MKVAFYAPLKPPDHPVPSGDRQLARALLLALAAGGHEPRVASRFRSFDPHGDPSRQARIAGVGARLAQRLVRRYRQPGTRPDVWFTYHLYHKAPDWLGPAVSRALGIPYVVAEASVAPAQRDGPWALGHAAAVAGVRAAAATLSINPADVAGVRAVRGHFPGDDTLPPFLDLRVFRAAAASRRALAQERARVRLVTVGMMRVGNKLASYRLLAGALARIAALDWELVVVGGGAARADVESAFAAIDPRRLRFAGPQPPERVAELLAESDLFVWPAIDEVIGMTFVEAQACGLPVVGGRTIGVESVVADGRTGTLVTPADTEAFAEAMHRLILDADARKRMGRAARDYVRSRHDIPAAAARIDAWLRRAVAGTGPAAAIEPIVEGAR